MSSKILLIGLTLCLEIAAQGALLTTYQFNGINAPIPDGNPNGYQNSHNIIDAPESAIIDVNVKLHISGGYNGDLYVYLTHSSGFSVLLNRTGRDAGNSFGYDDAGFNVMLDDSASTDIHVYGGNAGVLTGTWQPDARNIDPGMVLNTSERNAFLSSFNGLNPNGTWTLFAADISSGEQSTLVSWELGITTVPEPVTAALVCFVALLVVVKSFLAVLRSSPCEGRFTMRTLKFFKKR